MTTEITLVYPLILLVLPILIIIRYLRRKLAHHIKILLPDSLSPSHYLTENRATTNNNILTTLKRLTAELVHLAFLIILVLGAARPISTTAINPEQQYRRNIILSLDLSKSMEARDFRSPRGTLSRMEGVKKVTEDFINNRNTDRIGLVVFGSTAYLQAPLTTDSKLLSNLVANLRVGIAGDGTAIGDGIGMSLKRLKDLPDESRAIVLLTDGVSNSGTIDPLKAAQIARDIGVRVYTVGIGSREGGYINLGRGIIEQRMRADFDENSLKLIAEMTGGKYFFASDSNALDLIYREIDKIESSAQEDKAIEKITEFYPLLAVIAALLFFAHYILSQTLLRVLP